MGLINARVSYILSFILFAIAYFIIIPLVAIPYELLRRGRKGPSRLYESLCLILTRLLGIDLQVRGTENVRLSEGPAVIVLNHQTSLDALMISASCSPVLPAVTVMKEEVIYVGFGGIYLWLTGCIFIKRKASPKERELFNQQADERLKDKCNVVVFVEGTRGGYLRSEFLPFKKGAFLTAIRNQVPILPCVISPYSFIRNGEWYKDSGKLVMEFLPRVPTEGLKPDDVDQLISTAKTAMEKCYSGHVEELCN